MKTLRGLLAASFLFSVLFVINILQTVSLIIKPFSGKAFRRFNRWCANTWWGLCDDGAQKLYGVDIVYTGDELPMRENSVVVLNHQIMTDIPVVFAIAKAKGRLGDLKWFVKDVLKYVPGIGWGMLFLDCLFIKRNWTADKNRIHGVFENVLNNSIPLWLVSFAEGTRLTPEKLKRSQSYAKKKGLKLLHHVLIPRTKGVVASIQGLRKHIDAVYDFTIGYVGEVPGLWKWCKGEVKTVHLHIRRFPIASLPDNDQNLSDWVCQLYREKDKLLAEFYKNGNFVIPAGI